MASIVSNPHEDFVLSQSTRYFDIDLDCDFVIENLDTNNTSTFNAAVFNEVFFDPNLSFYPLCTKDNRMDLFTKKTYPLYGRMDLFTENAYCCSEVDYFDFGYDYSDLTFKDDNIRLCEEEIDALFENEFTGTTSFEVKRLIEAQEDTNQDLKALPFKSPNLPQGSICDDVIQSKSSNFLVVPSLSVKPFADREVCATLRHASSTSPLVVPTLKISEKSVRLIIEKPRRVWEDEFLSVKRQCSVGITVVESTECSKYPKCQEAASARRSLVVPTLKVSEESVRLIIEKPRRVWEDDFLSLKRQCSVGTTVVESTKHAKYPKRQQKAASARTRLGGKFQNEKWAFKPDMKPGRDTQAFTTLLN